VDASADPILQRNAATIIKNRSKVSLRM
jgi:hypothetical protein